MAKALELTLRDLAPADATGQRALDVHRLPWARGYEKGGAAHPGGGELDPQQVGLAANPGSTTASVDEYMPDFFDVFLSARRNIGTNPNN